MDILDKIALADAKLVDTSMSSNSSILLFDGSHLASAIEYRHTVGSLQHLSFTIPDIAFRVNRLSQFIHHPIDIHRATVNVKCMLQYLKGTLFSWPISHTLFTSYSTCFL